MDNLRNCSCPHQGGAAHLLAWPPHHWWFLLPVHQSPVSSLQPLCHDLQPEPADGTCLSTYCPDYTVRALSDLQFIKVMVWAAHCYWLLTSFVSSGVRPLVTSLCGLRVKSNGSETSRADLEPALQDDGLGSPEVLPPVVWSSPGCSVSF